MTEREFKAHFIAHYNMLCNYAARYSDCPEDIVQEIFSSIWLKKDSGVEIKNIKTYLLGAVIRKCAEVKRQNKLNFSELDENMSSQNVVLDTNEDKIQEEYEKNMLKEDIYHSIRQLPSKCQRIFVLAKIEEKSHKQIAEKLNIALKTVENQINKAYKILRELLKDKI